MALSFKVVLRDNGSKAKYSPLSVVNNDKWLRLFFQFLLNLVDVNVTFVCGRRRKGDRVEHNKLAVVSWMQLLCAQASVNKS